MRQILVWGFRIVIVLLIIAVSNYTFLMHSAYYPTVHDYLQAPKNFEGLLGENWGIVTEVHDSGFDVKINNDVVNVVYEGVLPDKNAKVTVLGRYENGGLTATAIRVENFYFLKYLLSAAGLIYLVYLLYREITISKKGLGVKNA